MKLMELMENNAQLNPNKFQFISFYLVTIILNDPIYSDVIHISSKVERKTAFLPLRHAFPSITPGFKRRHLHVVVGVVNLTGND